MNRRERRAATYLDSPAYRWAIDNDRPHAWAKKLAFALMWNHRGVSLEKMMGDKLTFTKMKAVVVGLTDNAVQVNIRIDSQRNVWANGVWVPRSNLRSDDDRRLDELVDELATKGRVATFLRVADWFRDSRKWTAVES